MSGFIMEDNRYTENQANNTAAQAEVHKEKYCENRDAFDRLILEKKQRREKGYIVSTNLSQDDDMDVELNYLFREPKSASYDRYVKTASTSNVKAMRAFVLDNICEEQRRELEEKLDVYPAMGISLGEKLLYMLGLSKTTSVRKL